MTKKDNIIAVIVTFNPPGDFIGRLNNISAQVDEVIIVDNSSSLLPLPQAQEKMTLIKNQENIGLSKALNQGIKAAKNLGATWVLLLDHDSQPEPQMIEKMLKTYSTISTNDEIALIAPEINDINTSETAKYLSPKGKFWFKRIALAESYNDKILSVITSGSLIKSSIFDEIGLMKESFFIDYIDHDFCLRLKKYGKKILLVKGAVLQHSLGDKTDHKIVGKNISTTNHSAFRRFHIFKNRIIVWKQYITTFPNFVIHDILASIFDIIRILLYEKQKWPKLKAITKGIYASFRKNDIY